MIWLKQHWRGLLISAFMLGLSFWHSDIFFVVALAYGWTIYFLIKKSMPERVRHYFAIIIWIAFILVSGFTVYVNYWLPHGPSYPTGNTVCENDGMGPCGEEYREDLQGLNIPPWAKFLRKSDGNFLCLGLLFAGIVINSKGAPDSNS